MPAAYTKRCTNSQTPDGDVRVLQFVMADDAEIGRENFRKLWGDAWSPSAAARQLWGTPAYWSDLYRGDKEFGEKTARRIEEVLGLVRMSLDDPDGPVSTPLTAELMDRLQQAGQDERKRLENMLRAHFGMPLLSQAGGSGPSFGKRRANGV